MEVKKTEIAFVVQGREVKIGADPSSPTGENVRLALEKLGIAADSEKWSVRTTEGRILSNDKSLIEEGIDKPSKLYLARRVSITTIAEVIGLAEQRSIEFKESTAWTSIKCVLTRTIMAMANLKGGGKIVIGVREDPNKDPVAVGMSKEDFDSYNQDDIASFVNEYAEPSVVVAPRKLTDEGKRYVVLNVEEFSEVPIVCKKDGRKTCKDHLRRGSIYHRPKRKVESTDRFDYADMRELVGLAAIKQHRLMHQQCAELYGTISKASPRTSRSDGESHSAKYSKEGEGF